MRAFPLSLLAASAATLAGAAQAAPLEAGEFSLSGSVGVETSLDGDVHGGATAPVASLRALNPNLPAAPAELRIESRSFNRIYGEAVYLELEGAYGIGGNREAFVALRHTKAGDGEVQVGTAFVPALNATLPVRGAFSDYKTTGIEVGLRQYFGSGSLQPYIAGRAGLADPKRIRASFVVPVPTGVGAEPNDIVLNDVPFYKGGAVWSAGVDLGASYELSENLAIGAQASLRYQDDLKGDDSAIGGLGLGSINNNSSRWSGSLGLRATVRF
jgi:opacity protein-like surface antigen